MVEHQPSKLDTWVRFPSPALQVIDLLHSKYAIVVQLVLRHLAKVEVAGSSPVYRFFNAKRKPVKIRASAVFMCLKDCRQCV